MPVTRRIALEWEVGWTHDPSVTPTRWVAAAVPGAVQLDWARAEGWPPYWHGNEFERYRWMEDVIWIYRARVPEMILASGEAAWLVLQGADPGATVLFDDGDVGFHAGRWLDTEVVVPPGAREIQVGFLPLGVEDDVQRTRGWGRYWKSAVQFGWDFCPRLIPIGLCAPAHLHVGSVRLKPDIATLFDPTTGTGRLTVAAWESFAVTEYRICVTLTGPDGVTWTDGAQDDSRHAVIYGLEVPNAQPWSPESPELYDLKVEAIDPARGTILDVWQSRIGFRRAELVHHHGAWELPAPQPGSETPPPFTLRLNGRDRFVHGTNWVPPRIFPGEEDEAVLRPLLEAAKANHFDLLRVWGGGGPMAPIFYDLCDELGLMVWQEFPLACARYEGTTEYMERLSEEATVIVQTLRWRPSLVLWSGGNELFCPWSRMTPQDPPMRELATICWSEDPTTPFIPTSPIHGVRHGDYRFVNHEDQEVHRIFAGSSATAYAEFGVPGPSPASVIRAFMPEADLWPPLDGTAWETHFWAHAWDGDPESWGMMRHLRHYFGEPSNLEELVEWGQLLQAEGLKQLYEEARRQSPRSGMALNWCFNEPWPCAANNSLIAWPCEPKPALAAVGASLRPQIVSAAVRRFTWAPGETMDVELWVLNDGPEDAPPVRVEAWLEASDGTRSESAQWAADATLPLRPQRGSVHRLTVPTSPDGRFRLHVAALDRPPMDSVYTFLHPIRT